MKLKVSVLVTVERALTIHVEEETTEAIEQAVAERLKTSPNLVQLQSYDELDEKFARVLHNDHGAHGFEVDELVSFEEATDSEEEGVEYKFRSVDRGLAQWLVEDEFTFIPKEEKR